MAENLFSPSYSALGKKCKVLEWIIAVLSCGLLDEFFKPVDFFKMNLIQDRLVWV